MTEQRDPGPAPERRDDDDDRPDWDRSPAERPPFDRDPDAQRAPGPGESDTDSHRPPMQAGGAARDAATAENTFDAAGIAREPVGNDNIRDGTVGGVMGPAHQTMGQGQGG
jgi:hypothetical protein